MEIKTVAQVIDKPRHSPRSCVFDFVVVYGAAKHPRYIAGRECNH